MILYAYGSALLTATEAREAQVPDRVSDWMDDLAKSGSVAPLSLDNGELSADMFRERGASRGAVVTRGASKPRAAQPTAWQPIAVGKPLTIDIREVYTGKHPSGGFFGGDKGMLVTSAVKGIATYDAKPLAVNFLTRTTKKNSRLTRPRASEEGTPVVYYSPAITDRSLTVDLSIVFDEFPKPVFDAVSTAFKSAAGVPIFLTASAYLLAAGEIARLAGVIGERLFDAKPVFEVSESIDLELPGAVSTVAGFMLMVPSNVDTLDPSFRNYQLKEGSLVDASGKSYAGDVPYVVLAVDGTDREDLSTFAPTAATAAVLSRFYGMKDGQSISLDPIMDALKLYNDFTYRSELDRLDKKLAGMKDGAEKTALAARRDALLRNITSDLLKPA